jgi:hypothetical protein
MDVCGQQLTPHRVTPGKGLRYPLKWRLDGFQSRTGRFGKEKNLFLLPEFDPWIVKPVA